MGLCRDVEYICGVMEDRMTHLELNFRRYVLLVGAATHGTK
jgi:hypothetical protein